MSLALPNPRPNGHLSLAAAIVLGVIALVVLAVLSLSGPRTIERFAQGTYYCQPFVGRSPFC